MPTEPSLMVLLPGHKSLIVLEYGRVSELIIRRTKVSCENATYPSRQSNIAVLDYERQFHLNLGLGRPSELVIVRYQVRIGNSEISDISSSEKERKGKERRGTLFKCLDVLALKH